MGFQTNTFFKNEQMTQAIGRKPYLESVMQCAKENTMSIKTTHQKAEVQIVNETGHNWLSVSLAHKYSDKYKDNEVWEDIPVGASTPARTVRYDTGLTETGLDWWLVSWVTDEGTVYVTDPHNFGKERDFLERGAIKRIEAELELAKDVLPTAVGAAVGTAIEPGGGTVAGAVAGVVAEKQLKPVTDRAVNLASKLATHLLNSESTAGFKEHVLRAKDSQQPTKIIITKQRVEFHSPSGVSKTRFRRLKSAAPAAA
jgi:hypothetical protein